MSVNCQRLRLPEYSYRKKGLGHRATERPLYCNDNKLSLKETMSDEHKMTKQDKFVLTITLAAIFFGVFALGLIGVIINISS
jgi:hypothetical protein